MRGIQINFIEDNLPTKRLPLTLIKALKELFLDYNIFITIIDLDEKASQR